MHRLVRIALTLGTLGLLAAALAPPGAAAPSDPPPGFGDDGIVALEGIAKRPRHMAVGPGGEAFAGKPVLVAGATANAPRQFFGVVPQSPPSPAEIARMDGVVGTLRVPAYWSQLEPRPGEYDFGSLDAIVGPAAEHGVRVLPFVYGSPPWLRPEVAMPPHTSARGRAAWTRLLRELVRRYGPRGELWQGRSGRLPIRRWQIWNEPNFLLFWRPHPSAAGYVRLLRISRRAIRSEDRGARIVAAGVAPVQQGMAPIGFLARMYRVPGARRTFDVAALHPYGTEVRYTAIYVRRARRAMARAGDRRKPLRITEVGVASAGLDHRSYDKGRHGQAIYLYRTYRLLLAKRRAWRIGGVDWFSWRDTPAEDGNCVFCQYSGLFGVDGHPKLAWQAMRAVSGDLPRRR